MARNTTRQTNARKVVYTPPNLLGLPDELTAWAKAQGLHLRWVRYQLEGQDDVRNLTRRENEGYRLVTAEELPDHIKSQFDHGRSGRTEGIIINGDVALAKIPVEMARARQEYYEDQHNMQEQALDAELNQSPGLSAAARRAMPIQNRSQTRTTTGRKPAIGAISEED